MTLARRAVFAILAAFSLAATTSCGGGSKAASPPWKYTSPPGGTAPAGLDAATWTDHLQQELLPFWTMDAAKGSPVGNFPTYRQMDGAPTTNTARKPRMMGRQIYAYATGYLLTGDESLLDLARAGNRWLLDHARDTVRGGWYADLDAAGQPAGTGDKLSQDLAYDLMGPAAFYVVTGDPESERAVLDARDLLFDPATYWDAANGRIRDGRSFDLSAEAFMGAQGSWELVAQLDPITAFLLVTQPVLSEQARRDQFLGDLRRLAATLQQSFWQDGFFWGSTGGKGAWGSNHSDFGHMLKTHWALSQIDKRLDDHPFFAFLQANTAPTLRLAYDPAPYDRWANRPTSATTVAYGTDWWAAAEADQLAVTLALHDASWIQPLARTAANFRADFVDRFRDARELVPSVRRDGSWYGWSPSSTAKCNEWKSGFHSTEHALVMFLFSHWLANTPAPLHFAWPPAEIAARAARATPYTFQGKVASVEDKGPLAGDPTRNHVVVTFTELR